MWRAGAAELLMSRALDESRSGESGECRGAEEGEGLAAREPGARVEKLADAALAQAGRRPLGSVGGGMGPLPPLGQLGGQPFRGAVHGLGDLADLPCPRRLLILGEVLCRPLRGFEIAGEAGARGFGNGLRLAVAERAIAGLRRAFCLLRGAAARR